METKNNKNTIKNQNLEEWFRSTGFLFPTNELELARFNKIYADYDFKLKDVSIDAKSIVEGIRCLSMDGLIMETKKFINIQDFMRFLNYSKEDIWVKNNKAYNASKQEVVELIINNKDKNGLTPSLF